MKHLKLKQQKDVLNLKTLRSFIFFVMDKAVKKFKLESLIFQEISNLIVTKKIKDPRVHEFLTVVKVKYSKDLINAKVFIGSIKEGASLDNALKALNNAKGYIQAKISERIKMRNTPKLIFVRDDSLSKSFYINKIIESFKYKQQKVKIE